MQLARSMTILLAIAGLSSCAPEPLEGFSDGGTVVNNGAGDSGGMPDTAMDMGGGGALSQEFINVANILIPSCGAGGCHGMPLGPGVLVFSMPSGVDSAPEDVRAALELQTPTNSGNRLITPNDPNSSEIYVRMTKPAGDPEIMPTTGALPMDQIQTVGNWITAGASYE